MGPCKIFDDFIKKETKTFCNKTNQELPTRSASSFIEHKWRRRKKFELKILPIHFKFRLPART